MLCQCCYRNSFLQIDKFYTIVRKIFKLAFRTVLLRRSVCQMNGIHSDRGLPTVQTSVWKFFLLRCKTYQYFVKLSTIVGCSLQLAVKNKVCILNNSLIEITLLNNKWLQVNAVHCVQLLLLWFFQCTDTWAVSLEANFTQCRPCVVVTFSIVLAAKCCTVMSSPSRKHLLTIVNVSPRMNGKYKWNRVLICHYCITIRTQAWFSKYQIKSLEKTKFT